MTTNQDFLFFSAEKPIQLNNPPIKVVDPFILLKDDKPKNEN